MAGAGVRSASMEKNEELERLAAQLRKLHAEIESYGTTRWWPTKAEEWVADLWRYDNAMVSAAGLLDIAVPPRPPQDAMRRLSPAERAELERLLAASGVDVTSPPPEESPAVAAMSDLSGPTASGLD
jgi:hypothetical protein